MLNKTNYILTNQRVIYKKAYILHSHFQKAQHRMFTPFIESSKTVVSPRPSMGSAQCFLGSPSRQGRAGAEERDWSSYLFTPEFLYFHSLLMGLQVAQQQ